MSHGIEILREDSHFAVKPCRRHCRFNTGMPCADYQDIVSFWKGIQNVLRLARDEGETATYGICIIG